MKRSSTSPATDLPNPVKHDDDDDEGLVDTETDKNDGLTNEG